MAEDSDGDEELAQLLRGLTPWTSYDEGVRTRNRHHPVDGEYFRVLIDRCQTLATTVPHGSSYYRARIMPLAREFESDPLPVLEMGAPEPASASSGRLNPEGIPYLYLADTDATAIAEVRPWRHARVSVARLTTVTDLRVADLRLTEELEDNALDPAHWAAFALSRPAHRDDRLAYVSTQFLAETLKTGGLDGVMYGSSLHPQGHNLALFDPSRAVVRDVQLFLVHTVTVSSTGLGLRDPRKQA